MPQIPQPEVSDSDFGDLATADQAALAEAAEKSRALAHYSAQAAQRKVGAMPTPGLASLRSGPRVSLSEPVTNAPPADP